MLKQEHIAIMFLMDVIFIIFTILGLSLFEIITSIDNAIINAEVLGGMSNRAKKWFLTWGIVSSIFIVRGVLPFLILYATVPQLGVVNTITAAFSSDPNIAETIKESSHVLLIAGGVFLIFLFFHWLFLEPKNFGLRGERFFHSKGVWFYAIVSILLTVIVWFAFKQNNPLLQFGAVVGSTMFFIIHGFKGYAEEQEKKLLSVGVSDFAKIAYLEILDASFSIDGVIGAFAFTFAIPLILIGNGLGAIVLRQITISNIERIKKYKYLKNGAMYSILILGIVMLLHSFRIEIPEWLSPVATFAIVGYFFYKSNIDLKTITDLSEPNKK